MNNIEGASLRLIVLKAHPVVSEDVLPGREITCGRYPLAVVQGNNQYLVVVADCTKELVILPDRTNHLFDGLWERGHFGDNLLAHGLRDLHYNTFAPPGFRLSGV